MTWPLIENQVRMQYSLLNHAGLYTRVRASNEEKGQAEKYLCGVEEILDWARPRSGHGNLYISRNPFTKDGQVAGVSGFTIDVDQIREPKDRATTEIELRRTFAVAQKINSSLGNAGSIATSGNGILLLYPFDEPITTDVEEFIRKAQQFEKQLKDEFQTEEVRIDATNYAKAILRLLGSPNCKDKDQRKWRYARFIHRPVFRSKRPGIRDAIKGITVSEFTGSSSPVMVSSTNQERDVNTSLPCLARSDAGAGLGPAARLGLAEESLGRLAGNRCEEYESWLKVGIALKEFGPAGFQLWDKWSRQSSKYSERDIRAKWGSFRQDQSLTVGTIKFWADQDDPERLKAQSRARAPLSGMPVLGSRGQEKTMLWHPGQPTSSAGAQLGAGIGTGFKWLDSKLNGGYRPGVVYGVEACTNVGKSAFIIQAARTVCERGKRVLLVTTESSVEEVCQRYWASGTGIPTAQISSGSLTEDGRHRLALYQEQFQSHQLGIWYTVSPRTDEIEAQINEFKPDILLWDYFQHFETGTDSRQIQLGSLARWFESTALRYQIACVVAAQLHERFNFKDRKKMPSIKDDIKDCKVLNDVCKTVIVMDWDSKAEKEDGPVLVRLSLDKNKGPMGETKVLLNRAIPQFEEIS